MAIPDFVLDASVLVAGIRPSEPYYADARSALESLSRQRANLCAPAIVLPEVAAAIGRGSGNPSQAARDVGLVRKLSGMEIVSIDQTLADMAAIVAAQQRIRGCDAVYVALARNRNATLITLDNEQRQHSPTDVKAQSPRELLDNWPAR